MQYYFNSTTHTADISNRLSYHLYRKQRAIELYKSAHNFPINYQLCLVYLEACINYDKYDAEVYCYKAMATMHIMGCHSTYRAFYEDVPQYLLINDHFKLATRYKRPYYDAYCGWCELLHNMYRMMKITGCCNNKIIDRFNDFLQATNNMNNLESKDLMGVESMRKEINNMISDLKKLLPTKS